MSLGYRVGGAIAADDLLLLPGVVPSDLRQGASHSERYKDEADWARRKP